MKHLTIVITTFFLILIQPQEKKLTGKYKMEYDYSYGSQNGIVTFDGDTYKRKQIDGKTIKGNIEYKQYAIFLNDQNSTLQVKFPKREIGNDTIFFKTTDLSDKSVDSDALSVYAGKLIRIK